MSAAPRSSRADRKEKNLMHVSVPRATSRMTKATPLPSEAWQAARLRGANAGKVWRGNGRSLPQFRCDDYQAMARRSATLRLASGQWHEPCLQPRDRRTAPSYVETKIRCPPADTLFDEDHQ